CGALRVSIQQTPVSHRGTAAKEPHGHLRLRTGTRKSAGFSPELEALKLSSTRRSSKLQTMSGLLRWKSWHFIAAIVLLDPRVYHSPSSADSRPAQRG